MTPEHATIQAQLDRIEATGEANRADIAWLRGEVGALKKKSSLWGILGGMLPAIVAHLGGCF